MMKTPNIILFNRIIVALILCFYLFFFLQFLQPFDSINYNHPYKTLQFLGYGLIAFSSYFISDSFSYRLRFNLYKNFILYFLIGSTACFLYTSLVMNEKPMKLKGIFFWMLFFALPVFITMIPVIYFSKKINFSEKIKNLFLKKIKISGENNKENLMIEPKNLVYVEAMENYVTIYYLENKKLSNLIFRGKLKNIEVQSKGILQFCHRSYLVNSDYILEIQKEGHKQFLILNIDEIKIPLSKNQKDNFSSQIV